MVYKRNGSSRNEIRKESAQQSDLQNTRGVLKCFETVANGLSLPNWPANGRGSYERVERYDSLRAMYRETRGLPLYLARGESKHERESLENGKSNQKQLLISLTSRCMVTRPIPGERMRSSPNEQNGNHALSSLPRARTPRVTSTCTTFC